MNLSGTYGIDRYPVLVVRHVNVFLKPVICRLAGLLRLGHAQEIRLGVDKIRVVGSSCSVLESGFREYLPAEDDVDSPVLVAHIELVSGLALDFGNRERQKICLSVLLHSRTLQCQFGSGGHGIVTR